MLWDTAITDAISTLSGKEQGARTRKLTQLGFDRLTSKLIILAPLALLILSSIFSPSAFTAGSLLCNQPFWYQEPPKEPSTCQRNEKGEALDPGLCRSRTPLAYLGAHRQFGNSWCWNNLIHYGYTERWTRDNESQPYFHQFKQDEDVEPISLKIHGLFPYILIIIAGLGSLPILVWTHLADDRIQPEVTFFRESLEALARTLYSCARSGKSMEDYFRQFSKSVDNLLDVEEGDLEDKELFEKLYGQFKTVALFMKQRSKSSSLLKLLYYYRALTLTFLLVSMLYLTSASLGVDMSEFTCKVDYTGSHPDHDKNFYNFLTCSILGVGLRLDMTRALIFVYFCLCVGVAFGSYSDYNKFKDMKNYRYVVALFRSVWPGMFQDLDEMLVLQDLKYLTVLASDNLGDNRYVKTIFATLQAAEHEVENDHKVNQQKKNTPEFDHLLEKRNNVEGREYDTRVRFMQHLGDMGQIEDEQMNEKLMMLQD